MKLQAILGIILGILILYSFSVILGIIGIILHSILLGHQLTLNTNDGLNNDNNSKNISR